MTTRIEPSNDEDVVNKVFLDTEISKVEGHTMYIKKDYKQHKLHEDKDEVLYEKALKTTIQIR